MLHAACCMLCTTRLTGSSNDTANVQDNVLAGDPVGQVAVDADEHVLGLGLGQRRGGQDVLHLRGSDPEGHGAKGPVRGGVAVAADGRAARQGEALLGADDVDDALPLVGHAEVLEAEILDVLLELQHLGPGGRLLDEGLDADEVGPVGRRDVVIDGDQGAVGPPHAAAGEAEALKGLGGRHLHCIALHCKQIEKMHADNMDIILERTNETDTHERVS